MPSRRLIAVIAALALAAPALLGCGSSDTSEDEERIEAVAEEFEQAIETKDPAAFCAVLAPSDVEKGGGEAACLKRNSRDNNVLFRAPDQDMSISEIEFAEDDTVANTTLANGGTLGFVKEDGEWYVFLPGPS